MSTGNTFRGAWLPESTYQVGDIVAYNGTNYTATSINTNINPNNASYWEPYTSTGTGTPGLAGILNWRGTWAIGLYYNPLDAVQYSGTSYLATVASQGLTPSANPANWNVLAMGINATQGPPGLPGVSGQGFAWRNTWSNEIPYNAYDCVEYEGSAYVCTSNSVLNVAPSTNIADWNLLAEGGSGGSYLNLEINGATNGSQTTLNLVAGSNVTLTDSGTGNITIASATQVNSDWNATSGAAQVLNKPSLGTASSYSASAFDMAGAAATVQTNLAAEVSRAETAEAACEKTANKNVANGYAGLDGTGKVPIAQLPTIPYSDLSGTPSIPTVPTLVAGANVTLTPSGNEITISASGSGGSGSDVTLETNGTPNYSQSVLNLESGTNTTVTNTTAGTVQVNVTGLGTAASHAATDFDAAGSAAAVQTNVSTEIARAEAAEALLLPSATAASTYATQANLTAEATTRGNADATNATAIATETTRAEAAEALKANTSSLATVATSGAYSSLSGLPTIPVGAVTVPVVDGTALIGSTGKFADAGHIHPTDISRQAAITLTTTGTSGTASLTGATLNIPQYAGAVSSLTVTGSGAATLSAGVLNIPTPVIPSVPITVIQNAGVSVTPSSGAINLIPGANVTLTTSGDGITFASTSTASTAFSALTGSTNTTAAMVVGTGASIYTSGSGVITATSMPYSGLTGTVPTWNQNTTGNAATSTTAVNLSGTPALPNGTTATTQTAGDNSTNLATDAFVTAAVLVETTRATNADALLAPKASPTFTGTVSGITATMVGLGNVTNNTQTQAAIVPNTAPASGQVLVGNAGGTAYAPVTLSGPVSVTSTGVTAVATLNQNTTGTAAATVMAIKSVSTNYSVLINDGLINCTGGSGGITVTLLDATTCTGRSYVIKQVDTGAGGISIVTTSSQTIDTLSSYDLANQNQFVQVVSDGTNWQVIGSN